MINKSIGEYFFFGTVTRFLQDVESGWKVRGDGYVLENLESFFGYLDSLQLQVTARASYELRNFLTEKLLKQPEDGALSAEDAKFIRNQVTDIRKTLAAEMAGFDAYITTPKRWDIKNLLSKIGDLFAPEVFYSLPEIAQLDFEEAGKCIAYERSTAAAFHLMRGTEAVLRHYYCSLIKQNRVDQMWGPIVQDLRKRNKTKSHTALNGNLDNIRLSFRNPTQHPEKVYDIQEAQDLLGLCIDVVNRMVKIAKG